MVIEMNQKIYYGGRLNEEISFMQNETTHAYHELVEKKPKNQTATLLTESVKIRVCVFEKVN